MNNLISIAIPVYEMRGVGVNFLKISLDSLCDQTYKKFEVVISDHSKNEDILNLCNSFSERIKIIYLKNEEKIGSSSANLNNALLNCNGDIVKILMQDEYLYSQDALEKIEAEFLKTPSQNWLINGCVFGKEVGSVLGSIVPYYSEDIVCGKNTIGSPSSLSIKRHSVELFNEDLLWVMDCEYYKRMYSIYGEPIVIQEPLVFVCQHKDQVSSYMDEKQKRAEEEVLKNIYKI